MQKRIDKKNHFISLFDEKNGFYLRTGIIKNGKDTKKNPFMAEFPELLDVGIMGHCIHGQRGLCEMAGIQCYQNGKGIHQNNMSMENFKRIVSECKGRTFQFALGGRGDPDQHEHFKEILKTCRESNIVPNFTSSGYGFNAQIIALCKEYCGAVAISWYRSEYTKEAIQALIKANVKTNIHYVLGNNTIDEAIELLEDNKFPQGINAIVFLLHKPIGLGRLNNVLQLDDKRVQQFLEIVDSRKFPYKIGFDSCTIPGLIQMTKNLDLDSLDTCEGGRWSAYITPDMKMLPCSFDNQELKWSIDLKTYTIEEAWNSEVFEDFRNVFRNACPECEKREHCLGGCPISPQIVLCTKGKGF